MSKTSSEMDDFAIFAELSILLDDFVENTESSSEMDDFAEWVSDMDVAIGQIGSNVAIIRRNSRMCMFRLHVRYIFPAN